MVSTTALAHDRVRLYFRPLNPTQFHVEGVRAEGQLYSNQAHAPILAMLVFDGASVLLEEDVHFSNGNLQRLGGQTRVGNNDAFFQEIDWKKVYHDGPWSHDDGDEIKRCRCAEVLAQSPMPIERSLQAIMCRSSAERATLLHLAGHSRSSWEKRVRVYSKPGIFYNKWPYVNEVNAGPDHIEVEFHHVSSKLIPVRLQVERTSSGKIVYDWGETNLDLGSKWKWDELKFEDGEYVCRIFLHGHLAHEAPFLIDRLPF